MGWNGGGVREKEEKSTDQGERQGDEEERTEKEREMLMGL